MVAAETVNRMLVAASRDYIAEAELRLVEGEKRIGRQQTIVARLARVRRGHRTSSQALVASD
jgi:hypothetical protein